MIDLPHRALASLRTRGLRATWHIVQRRFVLSSLCNPWFLSPKRILTRRFELRQTEPLDPALATFGNYWLDAARLDEHSIVYSIGVGTQIDFDRAVADRVGCPVWMFDPTPRSVDFMRSHADNPRLRFEPVGVWTENTSLRFYFDPAADSADEVRNASVTNIYNRDRFFEAPVETLRSLMARLGHDHIDVLKMDIEGAAVDVLEHALASEIPIGQVVVELERPRTWRGFGAFFRRVARLFTTLRERGYRIQRLPRTCAPHYSLEVVATRRTQ